MPHWVLEIVSHVKFLAMQCELWQLRSVAGRSTAYTNKYVDFEDNVFHATINAKITYKLEERGNTRDWDSFDRFYLITIDPRYEEKGAFETIPMPIHPVAKIHRRLDRRLCMIATEWQCERWWLVTNDFQSRNIFSYLCYQFLSEREKLFLQIWQTLWKYCRF